MQNEKSLHIKSPMKKQVKPKNKQLPIAFFYLTFNPKICILNTKDVLNVLPRASLKLISRNTKLTPAHSFCILPSDTHYFPVTLDKFKNISLFSVPVIERRFYCNISEFLSYLA